MKVITKTTDEREVTLQATITELVDLHDALKRGRKTKKDQKVLHELADALRAADPDLGKITEEEGNAEHNPA